MRIYTTSWIQTALSSIQLDILHEGYTISIHQADNCHIVALEDILTSLWNLVNVAIVWEWNVEKNLSWVRELLEVGDLYAIYLLSRTLLAAEECITVTALVDVNRDIVAQTCRSAYRITVLIYAQNAIPRPYVRSSTCISIVVDLERRLSIECGSKVANIDVTLVQATRTYYVSTTLYTSNVKSDRREVVSQEIRNLVEVWVSSSTTISALYNEYVLAIEVGTAGVLSLESSRSIASSYREIVNDSSSNVSTWGWSSSKGDVKNSLATHELDL